MKTWMLICLGVMLLVALTSARRGGRRGGGRRGSGGRSHEGGRGFDKPCLVEEVNADGETTIRDQRTCPTGTECTVNGGEGSRFVKGENNDLVTYCSDVIQGPPCFIDNINDDKPAEVYDCPRIDSSEETSEETSEESDEDNDRKKCDRRCKLTTVGGDGTIIRFCLERAEPTEPQPETPEDVRAEVDRADADEDEDDEDDDTSEDSDSRGDRRGRRPRPRGSRRRNAGRDRRRS